MFICYSKPSPTRNLFSIYSVNFICRMWNSKNSVFSQYKWRNTENIKYPQRQQFGLSVHQQTRLQLPIMFRIEFFNQSSIIKLLSKHVLHFLRFYRQTSRQIVWWCVNNYKSYIKTSNSIVTTTLSAFDYFSKVTGDLERQELLTIRWPICLRGKKSIKNIHVQLLSPFKRS